MTLIDTNILIYATIPGFAEHRKAAAFLAQVAAGPAPLHVTWINLFEYLRAVTHKKLVRPAPLPLDRALANVDALLSLPIVSRIDPGPQHLEVFKALCKEAGPVHGNFVHDCRIAAVMHENGVTRIYTRDTSFRRVPGLEVIDPLATAE